VAALMATELSKKVIPLIILAIIAGGFFLFMGVRTLVDQYYCVPTDIGEVKLISGVLANIEKSRRFGDSIVVDTKDWTYQLEVAGRLSSDLEVLRGRVVTVGVVDSPICKTRLMYVEGGGKVFLDFDTVLRNINRGAWFVISLSFVYFSAMLFIIVNTFFRVKKILISHGK
jgi:hypothetical protein